MTSCKMKYVIKVVGFVYGLLLLSACEDPVEKGYSIDYKESDAKIVVKALGADAAAPGETISYSIQVEANNDVRSCLVSTYQPGASGSAYDVSTPGFDDPFADHNYGIMTKGVQSFKIKYDYVVPEDAHSDTLEFVVVEERAKVVQKAAFHVVPAITRYDNVQLYAKDNLNNDAFASIDGLLYPDVKTNYTSLSDANRSVQEKIDIIFFVNNGKAILASPAHAGLRLDLDIENATNFKRISGVSHHDFDAMSAATLVEATKNDSILYYGSSAVTDFKVGDIIGFATDINAIHSGKLGLIKINQLHPSTIDRYAGKSYVLECDIITQIEQ